MADKENIFRFTRASKKRAADAAATLDDRSSNKRRVVLGELPILQNASSSLDRKSRSRATRHRRRVKSKDTAGTSAAAEINTLPQAEGDVKLSDEPNSEDPQMCRVYASDIYEYLRAMEVWVFLLFLN